MPSQSTDLLSVKDRCISSVYKTDRNTIVEINLSIRLNTTVQLNLEATQKEIRYAKEQAIKSVEKMYRDIGEVADAKN